MEGWINPGMVRLARETRGWTQQELGEKIGLHKANVSRLENGDTHIGKETLGIIAEVTDYPTDFFLQKEEIVPANLSYRKRFKVSSKILTPIEARMNVMRRHIQFFLRIFPKLPLTFPLYDASINKAPIEFAKKLRRMWGIAEGVIDNLTRIVEEKGIVIAEFDFGTTRVDSCSMLTDDKHPVIFLNSSLHGDKQRFSIAYEFGGILMHTFYPLIPKRDISKEANQFAAELLMPEKPMREDFKKRE